MKNLSLNPEEVVCIVRSLNADLLLINALPKMDEETTNLLKKRIILDMELIKRLEE